MRRKTRLALKLLVQKAHRLRDGRYVQMLQEQGGTKLTVSMKRDGDGKPGTTIAQIRPDDDATDALVLTFRFFIQEKEIASFRWLAENVLDDPGLSDEWKRGFMDARNHLNTYLDRQSGIVERVIAPAPVGASGGAQLVGEYQLTNRGIMVVFIYGGMAHANLEKWETFERWKSNPLAFPFMQCRFDETIMAGLGAIAYVCGLSERELAAQEGIPH
jgi:hypothetical protein